MSIPRVGIEESRATRSQWGSILPGRGIDGIVYTVYTPCDLLMWSQVRIRKMKEVIFLKFVQHETLLRKLLGTGNARLVADFDKDDFWGCGRYKRGCNESGKALMALRVYLCDSKRKYKQPQ
ncbi:hypothetical protein CPB85DRAFT_775765 [Mucidula mucida]|nr:hypothetical protein CPB85DRAFT_775765 [Mucidula mucida]